jgi:hypothetical protein
MRSSARRIGLALLGGVMASLIVAPAAASAATDPAPQAKAKTAGVVKPLAGPYVKIINKKSNKCLDRKSEDGSIDGTRIQQYHCTGSDDQDWSFEVNPAGFHKVINRAVPKCATFVLTRAVLWTCGSDLSQQWKVTQVETVPEAYFTFTNRATGRCLDVPNASTQDRVFLREFQCNGTDAQKFRFE